MSITINDVYERVGNSPQWALTNFSNGIIDITAADVIIQTVFFGEVLYGNYSNWLDAS